MKATLATENGTRAYLRIYWDGECSTWGYHNAMLHLVDSDKIEDWKLGGGIEDHADSEWPTVCEHCGIAVPVEGISKQVHHERKYDTPSGSLEPGCLFWDNWLPQDFFWDNQNGPHLNAMLPNGHRWNIDSRASNCGLPDDRQHRCWVRHGEPPNIHVDKNGFTCNAGAGSIIAGNYHGHLENGEFREC